MMHMRIYDEDVQKGKKNFSACVFLLSEMSQKVILYHLEELECQFILNSLEF